MSCYFIQKAKNMKISSSQEVLLSEFIYKSKIIQKQASFDIIVVLLTLHDDSTNHDANAHFVSTKENLIKRLSGLRRPKPYSWTTLKRAIKQLQDEGLLTHKFNRYRSANFRYAPYHYFWLNFDKLSDIMKLNMKQESLFKEQAEEELLTKYLDLKKKYEQLTKKLEKLEEKYKKDVGKPSNVVKYMHDNYKEILQLYENICTKHHCLIRNKKILCEKILLTIEGNKNTKPIYTPKQFLNYLKLVDFYSEDEFLATSQYIPTIKNEFSLLDRIKERSDILIKDYNHRKR